MIHSISELLSFRSLARAALACALTVLLLGVAAPPLAAQSDDFNDGNDAGWTHYSLTDFYYPPYGYVPYGGTTYTFPNDDSGGKAYHMEAAATGDDPWGVQNARGGSYLTSPTYTNRFSVGSDLLAWSTTGNPTFGLMWYMHDIDLGTTAGYVGTFSPNYENIYISIVSYEAQEAYCGRVVDGEIKLDSSDRIRLEASSHDGLTFVLTVYNLLEPNTPWASAIGQDTKYYGVSGVCGYLLFNEDYPATYGAGATFDNYAATEPAANTMPAMVTDAYPPPGRKATDFYPTVTVMILDRDTSVASYDAASIALCMDGVWLPSDSLGTDWQINYGVQKPSSQTGPTFFSGATITYPISNLFAWGSKHTNIIAFKDSAATWRTNTWTWTTAYPYLFASNSLPIGSLSQRGFDTRMVQSYNGGTNLANTLDRARQQLAIPPQIPIDQTATSIVQVLDWNKASAPPANVPGLCPGTSNNIAVECLTYLELKAGVHRFHINTDDRSGVYSGANLAATTPLWESSGNTANTTFDFVVEADGLYPFNLIWEETGGSAALHLWSTNFVTGDPEVLINDSSDPAGVVKAWYPVVCKSSSSVSGPYTVASSAVNVLNTEDIVGSGCGPTVVGSMVTGGTFTVPISGTAQFYYLDAGRTTKITDITKNASDVVITYQVQ